MQDQGSKAHRGIGFITFASAGRMISCLPWCLLLILIFFFIYVVILLVGHPSPVVDKISVFSSVTKSIFLVKGL